MSPGSLFLPSLALGAAALLLAPTAESPAFTVLGGTLDLDQRDVRVFDNFADKAANNNFVLAPQFPGFLGAELAIWKGAVEWGSEQHGDGSGDSTQPTLGDGGANFDAHWSGAAAEIGTTNENVVSGLGGCPQGLIAFTETPVADGWRIRFCDDSFLFSDGPGFVSFNEYDIQGIMTHEYGHALGLGHSAVSTATMFASASAGSESERSLEADDTTGLHFLYGPKRASKPLICESSAVGGVLTLHGAGFDTTDNEVWFTSRAVNSAGNDPRVAVTGVVSSNNGTRLDVLVPAAAGPGDVVVRLPGGLGLGELLSNAFPTDLLGTLTSNGICPFSITGVSPAIVDALVPGDTQFLSLTGLGFLGVTAVTLDPATPVLPSSYTIIDDGLITIDLPQAEGLGPNSLTLEFGSETRTIDFTIVSPEEPKLQLGTGVHFNTTRNGEQLQVLLSGEVGARLNTYYSLSPIQSSVPVLTLQFGNRFAEVIQGPSFTIPASGYRSHLEPIAVGSNATVYYVQSVDVTTLPSPTFGTSNLQIITLSP